MVNGKIYVGQSVDCFMRWHLHKHHLRRGTHKSRHLQSAWNKYGEDSFEFGLLQKTDLTLAALNAAEQVWMDRLRVCDPRYGYNTNILATSSLGVKRSSETSLKMSLTRSGVPTTKTVFSGEKLQELLRLRATGMSAAALGRYFGTTGATVQNTLRGAQIRNKSVTDPLPSFYRNKRSLTSSYSLPTVHQIRSLLFEGVRIFNTARGMGLCRKTVSKISKNLRYKELPLTFPAAVYY